MELIASFPICFQDFLGYIAFFFLCKVELVVSKIMKFEHYATPCIYFSFFSRHSPCLIQGTNCSL